jgi:hypothetical protein
MKRSLIAAAMLLALSSAAEARHHRHGGRLPWCGFYMMKVEGKKDPRLARAIEWARECVNAGGPGIGVIVVWPHHVGKIVGQDAAGNWLVNSGNDGGRVRTRALSLARVIAYRRV